MERAPLEQRLHEPSPRERLRQLVALEAVEPRPEREIGNRRRLRLQAAEPLDRLNGAQWLPLEQELPLEQGAVEVAPREDTLGSRHAGEASSAAAPV